jgi:hypothetical protein
MNDDKPKLAIGGALVKSYCASEFLDLGKKMEQKIAPWGKSCRVS